MKALCASEIIDGRVRFSLFAKVFSTILYNTFHKEIGLKSDIFSGLFFFWGDKH